MSENSEDYELFHYGVKGMKWGVRRDKKGSSSGRKGVRQRIKERDEKIKSARDKNPDLWDKESAAIRKSASTRVSSIKNIRNSEKRAEAKQATSERKAATKARYDNERMAKKLTSKELAARGAIYAVPTIASVGYLAAGTAATRRNAKIGQKLKNDIFADTKGLPKAGTIALQFIDGVWQ